MSWGLRVVLAPVAVVAVLAAGAPALGAKPLLGTVQRGWISKTQSGPIVTVVPQSSSSVFASFVWKHSPTAALPLEMRWIGPQGFVRATWKSTTLKTDVAGTRLFSRVSNGVIKGAPGTWRVRLLVNNVVRGQLQFRVTS